jgi:hypothetical protein
MTLANGNTLTAMGRTKQMPLEVAEHLARVVKPYIDEIGSTVEAGKRWGISQSHVSQIQLGAGCGVSVLLTLRDKLNMSLEELCFPEGRRKGAAASRSAPAPELPLDAIRAALRAELEEQRRESSPPTEPPAPPKKGPSDAPRARRR